MAIDLAACCVGAPNLTSTALNNHGEKLCSDIRESEELHH